MVPRGFHGRGTGLAVVDSEERDQEQSTGGLQELGGGGGAKEKKGFCPRGSRWDASLLIL